ncbi:MAG: amidophosphoribosyltransferase [Thermoplasmata archaeon]
MSTKRGAHTVAIPHQGSEAIIGRKSTEYCGVLGFKSHSSIVSSLYFGLRSLQHRGQESAGISLYNNNKVYTYKGMGLVHEVFTRNLLDSLSGNSGIGHVRYSTAGSSIISNAQPIMIHTAMGDMAIAHNGEISNAADVREYLERAGDSFFTESDTELILKLIALESTKRGNIIDGIKKSMRYLKGSYSLAFQINDRIFAIRDPLGIRPLVLGKLDGGYGIASESVVFDALGGKTIRDIYPGEILEIEPDEAITHYRIENVQTAFCMFEYVYFARADSTMNSKNIYSVRKNLGKFLAREHPADADIVVPVPDSGRTHALGYAEEANIPFAEGLMKNRYIDRTFIMPSEKERVQEIQLKLNPIKEVINGKKIVLIDDSIVRGNTTKKIVKLLKNAGAEKVHVRIASPPIIAPCYLGIDMKTRSQFIASGKTVEEIREIINADSLGYLSIAGLVKAIGINENDLCLGCLTGTYPVPIKGEKYRDQLILNNFYKL